MKNPMMHEFVPCFNSLKLIVICFAEKIFLSYHTVREHVKNIYQKLHVASATEAVAKALKEKLV